ncbi:MAG: helix-turn-helix domain-containing protein [Clostridia bacterium]
MSKKEIGIRIKHIRENMNMSKEELAKLLGISGQYLGTIERGKSCLSIDKLEKLCNLTHLSADFILFGKDYNIPETTRKLLSKYTDDQIITGCLTLEQLALFIKHI